MILFEKIRFKNFLSFGNVFTEINILDSKNTLVVGKNGAGKSSAILDTLAFGLYNKPFRKINKPQLLNTINQRDLLVEIEFSIGSDKYKIRRGMKPTIFEILKNGALLNQDSANIDYQVYLEENILKMNFKSFSQVIILGSSTFTPFMQLTAANRREIIEDLLDLQVFSVMNTLVKERVSDNKTRATEVQYNIKLVENNIKNLQEYNQSLQKMSEDQKSRLKEKMQNSVEIIQQYQQDISQITQQIHELTDSTTKKKKYENKSAEYSHIQKSLTAKLLKLKAESEFYENNDSCPTCLQEIDQNHKCDMIKTKEEKQSEIESSFDILKLRIDQNQEQLEKIYETEKSIRVLQTEVRDLELKISIEKTNIKNLEKELCQAEKEKVTVDTSRISEYKKQLKDIQNSQEDIIEERETLGVVAQILKDSGIKAKIIKQYIPVINKLINKYLNLLDFYIEFQLDETFNEKILSMHRDEFSYSSFSEGEKTRIDLALIFAWRAIAKMRNSVSTNLLIMDEILDGSLDNNGIDEFLKIIAEITVDNNVFIISHKGDTLYDKFDRVLRFNKEKNFSIMEEI